MMASWHREVFCITGPFDGYSPATDGLPSARINTVLMFFNAMSVKPLDQTVELAVMSDTKTFMWHHWNDLYWNNHVIILNVCKWKKCKCVFPLTNSASERVTYLKSQIVTKHVVLDNTKCRKLWKVRHAKPFIPATSKATLFHSSTVCC